MKFEHTNTGKAGANAEHSRNRFDHPALKAALPEALRSLEADALDELSFIDHYGEDAVQRDIREVSRLEGRFEQDNSTTAAKVLEAIFHQHVELSDWLGPQASTIRTTKFDDFKNGIDGIVEFNEADSTSRLALGIDVTFGTLSIQKKFDRILGEIETDTLARVKYFRAHGYEGSLTQLPRVVIGVDIDKVIALAGLWNRQDNAALSTHIAKDIIADEIEKQLRTFLLYAQSMNKPESVRSYTQAYNTVRRMHTKRNGFSDDRERMNQVHGDHVYSEIMDQLKRFQPSFRYE
jgi:hypothetical protein